MDQTTYLNRFEERLDAALTAQSPEGLEASQILLEAGRHLAKAPGAKRARPTLVRHFGHIVGVDDADALLDIAIAGEFIHGASLLHDDVVDSGTLRRGRVTVNARWNNAVAVLGGDVMLCIAIETLASLPRPITNEAVAVVATMSRAAVMEVETRGDIDLSLDAWRAIAAGKTGALFGWCGRSPAHIAGDAEAADRFKTCGEELGVAFQLADDLKDLTDPDSGKNRFSDIRNHNPSYPVLWATRQSPTLYKQVSALWEQTAITNEEAHNIGVRVLDTGAADVTRAQIIEHVGLAFDALGPYRDTKGGEDVVAWANNLSMSFLESA